MNPYNLKRIIWLASYPKSGNTWLRMFLDAYVTGQSVDLNTVYGHFSSGDLHPASYQAVCPWPLNAAPRYIWVALRFPALLQMMAYRPGVDLALKTHHGNYDLDGLRLCPPRLTKSAVYLVRDPRDVAISWSHHANITIDQSIAQMESDIAQICNDKIGLGHLLKAWSTHVNSWIAENDDIQTVALRYEDMVVDPVTQFKMVLEKLQFPDIDEDRLRWAVDEVRFDKLRTKEEEEGFREKRGGERFFRKGKSQGWRTAMEDISPDSDDEIGCPELIDDVRPRPGWKRVLSAVQVKRIEESHGDVMAACGYELCETTLEELIAEKEDGSKAPQS